MHACGVRHGDLKPENVLLTSWNWLLLSDLAPYKPVFLNLEHTADFTYFFDTSGSRRCCLAPERFLRGTAAVARARHAAHVSAAMDVFAAGCVITELWIGTSLFQYSDMMSFVQNQRLPASCEVCNLPADLPGSQTALPVPVIRTCQVPSKDRAGECIHKFCGRTRHDLTCCLLMYCSTQRRGSFLYGC